MVPALRIIIVTFSLLLLASCGDWDQQEVERSVQEEFPEAEILYVNSRLVFVPRGLLRYAADVDITYKVRGDTNSKTVTWYYENPDNTGWRLFAKKSFSDISSSEYSDIVRQNRNKCDQRVC